MTATIAPTVTMAGTARIDSNLRRQDYMMAFLAYLAMPRSPERILFCENSDADLDDFRRAALDNNPFGKQVDFLSFQSQTPSNRGKGFAELDILDRTHEEFFRTDPDGSQPFIWKVTGRLVVPNFEQMVLTAPPTFDLYADFRSVPLIGERLGGNDWMDTRLFAYTPRGYERYLYQCKQGVGWTIEKSLYDRLRPRLSKDTAIVPRFRSQPLFNGVCGGSAVDYGSVGSRLKLAVRSVARSVVPSLWL